MRPFSRCIITVKREINAKTTLCCNCFWSNESVRFYWAKARDSELHELHELQRVADESIENQAWHWSKNGSATRAPTNDADDYDDKTNDGVSSFIWPIDWMHIAHQIAHMMNISSSSFPCRAMHRKLVVCAIHISSFFFLYVNFSNFPVTIRIFSALHATLDSGWIHSLYIAHKLPVWPRSVKVFMKLPLNG